MIKTCRLKIILFSGDFVFVSTIFFYELRTTSPFNLPFLSRPHALYYTPPMLVSICPLFFLALLLTVVVWKPSSSSSGSGFCAAGTPS